MIRYFAILGLALSATPAHAHGGGLDANGCHNDRKNGGYHCHKAPAPQPRTTPETTQPRGMLGSGSGGAFANCAAARAAGAAPVRRGESGYGPHLDRDNDGIGCE